jgi:hypothetical protein
VSEIRPYSGHLRGASAERLQTAIILSGKYDWFSIAD